VADFMSESDFVRVADAYRASVNRTARMIRDIWETGSTNPSRPVCVEFCAADFCVEVL
jgi:hypothetical protein